MDYKALIEERQSVREFKRRGVPQEDLDEIRDFYEKAERLLPDLKTELRIYNSPEIKNRMEGVVGYKGFAFGAPVYLVLLSEKADGYMLNAGFIGEELCLKLTDMELDSCWLTVNESAAAKRALILDTDLEVVVVLAIGYGKSGVLEKRLDIFSPSNIKLNDRTGHAAPKIAQEELVYSEMWGSPVDWSKHAVDPLLDGAFYAASLAPSFLNRQPYRYIMRANEVILCGKKEEMATEDDTFLDLGATMFNFHIAFSGSHSSPAKWTIGVPDDAGNLGLPAEYEIVAYYRF